MTSPQTPRRCPKARERSPESARRMDMARVLPAEAGPTPSAADLEAYDAILGASRLTFRLVNAPSVCTTFRVDADGTKDAFSILVNHDRARPGENRANDEPFGAFVADVVLGDGSDNRVVQTVTCSGQMDWKEFMYNKKSCPRSNRWTAGTSSRLRAAPRAAR